MYPALGAIVGCWAGALPLPLDWGRPWQVRFRSNLINNNLLIRLIGVVGLANYQCRRSSRGTCCWICYLARTLRDELNYCNCISYFYQRTTVGVNIGRICAWCIVCQS